MVAIHVVQIKILRVVIRTVAAIQETAAAPVVTAAELVGPAVVGAPVVIQELAGLEAQEVAAEAVALVTIHLLMVPEEAVE